MLKTTRLPLRLHLLRIAPIGANHNVEPCLILRPRRFDPFVTGVIGQIGLDHVCPDNDHPIEDGIDFQKLEAVVAEPYRR